MKQSELLKRLCGRTLFHSLVPLTDETIFASVIVSGQNEACSFRRVTACGESSLAQCDYRLKTAVLYRLSMVNGNQRFQETATTGCFVLARSLTKATACYWLVRQ